MLKRTGNDARDQRHGTLSQAAGPDVLRSLFPPLSLSGNACVKCGAAASANAQYSVLAVAVALWLFVWYQISWRPIFDDEADSLEGGCGGSARVDRFVSGITNGLQRAAARFLESTILDYWMIVIHYLQLGPGPLISALVSIRSRNTRLQHACGAV